MGLSPTARRAAYPRQTSTVTCGIAALAAVAGRCRFPQYLEATGSEVAAKQAHLHQIASRTGLPWPRFLGTSPWALAALAGRLTGHRYSIYPMWRRQKYRPTGNLSNLPGITKKDPAQQGTSRGHYSGRGGWTQDAIASVMDEGPDGPAHDAFARLAEAGPVGWAQRAIARVVDAGPGGRAHEVLAGAVEADLDCFIYVGGNAKEWQRWIPRHVVAVLGEESTLEMLQMFEPSSGKVFEVSFASLFDRPRRGSRPEFGQWRTPLLAVLPNESRGRGAACPALQCARGGVQ